VEKLDAVLTIDARGATLGAAVRSESNSGEIVLRVDPGHYEIAATQRGLDERMHRRVMDPRSGLPPIETHYGATTADVFTSGMVRELTLTPTLALTARMLMENAAGQRTAAPSTIRCNLSKVFSPACPNARLMPGPYEFSFQGLPADAYVLSIKEGDRDILAGGLNVTRDTDLEIVFVQPGEVVDGVVRTVTGAPLADAAVALVPDAPYRATGLRYRAVVTDPRGRFELHGVAPGSYKLFAWPELEGAAYRNAEFMKEFEDRGKPLKVDKGAKPSVDLTVF
jgi:hypothetical protein